jgi:hypothetical protein
MKRSDFKDGEIYVLENFHGNTFYIKKNSINIEKHLHVGSYKIQEGYFFENYETPYRHATQLEADYLNYCIDNNKCMFLKDFKKINMPSYEIY